MWSYAVFEDMKFTCVSKEVRALGLTVKGPLASYSFKVSFSF